MVNYRDFVCTLLITCLIVSVHCTSDDQEEDAAGADVEKQKKILDLLLHVMQTSNMPEHMDIAKTFNPMKHPDIFTDKKVIENYALYYEDGLLPRDAIFSIYYEEHLREAICLFRMFYHAKDWDAFYKTAVWARQNVNPVMFVYAMYVHMIHNPIVGNIYLPPIYEVLPHFFFSSEVIQKAQKAKMMHDTAPIIANYSGDYLNLHPEQYLSMWMEDVEVNAQNFYRHVTFPFWLKNEEVGLKNNKKGSNFVLYLQNIIGRIYLERLSNGFGVLPVLDFYEPIQTPYVPSLIYPNGMAFPERPMNAKLRIGTSQKHSYVMPICTVDGLYTWERRVDDAIGSGTILDVTKGTMMNIDKIHRDEVMGNFLQGSVEGPWMYYGNFLTCARRIFGYALDPLDSNRVVPSALEHEMTAMRDPMFYQLLKRLLMKYRGSTMQLTPYPKEKLVMSGVTIEKITIDDLFTYDEMCTFDLTNAVYFAENEKRKDYPITVKLPRLNHKRFTIKVNVKSNKEQEVVVRIFMAPMLDEYGRRIHMTENLYNVVLLDHFRFKLRSGDNVIRYDSHNSKHAAPDRLGFGEMYRMVESGKGSIIMDRRQNSFEWPRRHVLPTSSPQGLPLWFVVYIHPMIRGINVERKVCPMCDSTLLFDDMPMMYPFDRGLVHPRMLKNLPNFARALKTVYYKDIHEVNK